MSDERFHELVEQYESLPPALQRDVDGEYARRRQFIINSRTADWWEGRQERERKAASKRAERQRERLRSGRKTTMECR